MTTAATTDLTPAEYLQRIRSPAVYDVATKTPLDFAPDIVEAEQRARIEWV